MKLVVATKLISLACLLLLAVLLIHNHHALYWIGYLETSRAFAERDPLIGLLCASALFLVLLVLLLISLIRKKERIWILFVILLYWPIFFLAFKFPSFSDPGEVYGLRDRILKEYNLDDLRHFAHDYTQTAVGLSVIDGSVDIRFTPEQTAAFDKLKEKYPFLNWGISKPSIFQKNGTTNLDWQGPLNGHWGFSVTLNGRKNNPPNDPEFTILPASNDIYFYYETK